MTVSFRIDASLVPELQTRATDGGFHSVHNYARHLLLDGLANEDVRDEITRLEEGLKDIATELADLRFDMRSLTTRMFACLAEISLDEAERLLDFDHPFDDQEMDE